MEVVKEQNDIKKLQNNKVLGEIPELQNSIIEFSGSNNVLYCESSVVIKDSILKFKGNNSLIFLGANRHSYIMNVIIYHNSVFHMGVNNYMNGEFGKKLFVMISEQKHCFIGDNCYFSFGVCIRNSDSHLIYDCISLNRINPTKSVFVGDHVWIGQDCTLLKGIQIDSGSIIGANSLVAGKRISSNTLWAGNPCRKIKDNVFWDRRLCHDFEDDISDDSNNYATFVSKHMNGCTPRYWIHEFEAENCVSYEELERHLSAKESAEKKAEYLMEFNKKKSKNRFVHNI